MAKREKALQSILGDVAAPPLPRPMLRELGDRADAACAVFRALGGVSHWPLQGNGPGPWDAQCEGVAIELDEEGHFNRYRLTTLASPLYRGFPAFALDDFRRFCAEHESDCARARTWGKGWSNASCVSQFGSPAAPSDFSGNGAPRWKQRAFYDFLKDLAPPVLGVRVARIAIWDTVDDGGRARSIDDVLTDPWPSSRDALMGLIGRRAGRAPPAVPA